MKNKNKQTKFPVARIKKIMQKDEEVGKVAQATPIVISKALERFLALIVAESSNIAISRGSKRVEAYHLKHAVETTEMLDFLKEIVEGVPDPSAGGTIGMDGDNGEGTKKKRGKGKKSAQAEEESGDQPPPKKRRRKKNEVQATKKTETELPAFAPPPMKMEGVAEGDEDVEDKSDHDADEDEDDRSAGYGAYGRVGYSSRRHEMDSEWRDVEEDKPYMPRS